MNPNFSRSRLTLLVLACCLALTACRTRLKTTVESAPPPPPPPAEPAEKVRTPPARAGRVEPKEPPAAVLPRTAPVAPPPKAPPETPPPKIGVVPVPAPPPLLSTPGKPINDVTTGVAPRGIPPKDVPAAPAPFVQPAIQTPLPGVPPVDANRPPGAKAPWPAAVIATPAGSVPGKPPEVLSLSRSTPGTPEMVRGANDRGIGLNISFKAPPGVAAGSTPGPTGLSLARVPGLEDRPATIGSRSLSLPVSIGGSAAGTSPSAPAPLTLPAGAGADLGPGTNKTTLPAGSSRTIGFDPLLAGRKDGATWREQQLLKQAAEQQAREEEQQKLKDALHRFLFKAGTNR